MPFRPRYTGLIDKYRDRLPVHDHTRITGLGEGNTPLIRPNNIPRVLGKNVDIDVKSEGLNRTGSFKDRGITKAVDEGGRAIISATIDKTSAAAAAYAARAGIPAFVLIPDGSLVCTLAGHSLKDPDTAIEQSKAPLVTVDAELDAEKRAIVANMAG